MRRLLSNENGVKEWFYYDLNHAKHAEERQWGIEYEFADFSHEIEASKTLQNDPDHWKKGVKDEMVHYAHVPDSILLRWHSMGVNINDPKALIEMVNKPDWSYLKCVDKVHIAKA